MFAFSRTRPPALVVKRGESGRSIQVEISFLLIQKKNCQHLLVVSHIFIHLLLVRTGISIKLNSYDPVETAQNMKESAIERAVKTVFAKGTCCVWAVV